MVKQYFVPEGGMINVSGRRFFIPGEGQSAAEPDPEVDGKAEELEGTEKADEDSPEV